MPSLPTDQEAGGFPDPGWFPRGSARSQEHKARSDSAAVLKGLEREHGDLTPAGIGPTRGLW